MTGPIFLVAFGIAAMALVGVARAVAAAMTARAPAPGTMAELREQLERHAVALEDDEARLALHAGQLAELQERLDFAERLIHQSRDERRLGRGVGPP